jgi:peptide/nickel transport system permease protein
VLLYVIRRLLTMAPLLFVVSVLAFVIIQLPPGDYLTTYIASLESSGEEVNLARVERLRQEYGLDRPLYVQYGKWIGGIFRGDLGRSFLYDRPVTELIWDRLGWTVLIVMCSLVVSWLIAIPIGILSAVKQYGVADYSVTFLGFIGMAAPPFLLALLMMLLASRWFGLSLGGLFSPQYQAAPWTFGKFVDLLKHLWVPVVVLSVAGIGATIRTIRANLLDQLHMPYVEAARARGLSEWRMLLKYPVRLALNPLISSIGGVLPALVSGSVIVAVVLNIPTVGPLLLESLLSQDMYLAGSLVMILAVLTMIGTVISDLLLAWLDPRIRFGRV